MDNEIAFNCYEDASAVAKILLNNDYVCMLSNEDDLTILNFIYSDFGDRNNVVFMDAEIAEEERWKECKECHKEREEDCKACRLKMENEVTYVKGEDNEYMTGDCCND